MFHVSLRYIFGIPPLILVLLPVASPDCEIEGKNGEEYRHVLMVSFEILEAKKSLKEQRKQDDMCFLKMLLQQIKTCWNKILRGTKEH